MDILQRTPTVIFDCDGVLVDSEALVTRIESELLLGVGVELSPEEIGDLFVGLSDVEMHRQIHDRWGIELDTSFNTEKTRLIGEAFATELQPVLGIGEVLRLLSARNIRCCVASSSDPERIRSSLKRTGMDEFFGANLFSATMVRRGKPAPDLFLHAAKMMNAQPERCVVVEDSPYGVAAGVAAGMEVVGFTGASHCGPQLASRLRETGASHIARSAKDLGEILVGPPRG